ncbi:MAG: group II intron maturase-specific domain-containing protein [Anaerocolumna sp.]
MNPSFSILHKKTGCKIEMIAEVINPMVRGWINYFGKYNPQAIKYSLDCVERRLINWAIKRFQGCRRRAEIWLIEVRKREPFRFARWTYRSRNVVLS